MKHTDLKWAEQGEEKKTLESGACLGYKGAVNAPTPPLHTWEVAASAL